MQTGLGQRSELGWVGVEGGGGGQGGGGGGGEVCYENSHKDRLSMIKGLVMLCKRNWRKEKKKYPKKKNH